MARNTPEQCKLAVQKSPSLEDGDMFIITRMLGRQNHHS